MRTITPWPAENDALLRAVYPDIANKEITRLYGWSEQVLKHRAKLLRLKKTKACKANQPNATKWTDEMRTFLIDNFFTMNNSELAAALGLRLTVTRNKARELGLRRSEKPDPWTEGETAFLLENYGVMADIEIAEHFKIAFPGKRIWRKKHISKKRILLNLHRTPAQLLAIVNRFHLPGGRCDNIAGNSCSVNLTDGYVVTLIAWRDKGLQQEILKHPELIELKRQEIRLSRAIKEVQYA